MAMSNSNVVVADNNYSHRSQQKRILTTSTTTAAAAAAADALVAIVNIDDDDDENINDTRNLTKNFLIKKLPQTKDSGSSCSSSSIGGGDDGDIDEKNKIFYKNILPIHNKIILDISSTTSRNFNSLPLFHYVTELSEIGSGQPVMECMPLRQTSGGSYHHHYHHQHNITEQTKSLQELQNEVGALLEFRDLVIETFPDLKNKMASLSATTNTLTGLVSNSSLASRREWEPGIRVKRKLTQQKDTPASPSSATANTTATCSSNAGTTNTSSSNNNQNNVEMSSTSSLIRSRSNSHSGKKEPKSGEGNGSVVQDSGFSTETSSSKEAHSASSTTGAMQGAVATNRLHPNNDSDDELLNLLDVIHRKSNRLRDEVEHLQNLEKNNKILQNSNNNNSNININNNSNGSQITSTSTTNTLTDSSQIGCINHKQFQDHVDRLNKEDIQMLRHERDRLLDKLAEMEAETLTGRIKATKFQDQVEQLITVKKDLEEQLKLALSQKLELNTRLHDLSKQYNSSKSSSSQSESSSHRHSTTTIVLSTPTTTTKTFSPIVVDHNAVNDDDNIIKNDLVTKSTIYPFHNYNNDAKNLGRLDGIISEPNRINKVRVTDSKKITAILLETNVIELQRHLLTLTVQNQVLTQRLEQATKSKMFLNKRLEKSKEDLDDLRFQLEEKDIELEGTKAQLRVLESRTPSKIDFNMTSDTNRSSSTVIIDNCDSSSILVNSPVTQISTPSMKAMIPLQMDEMNQQHHSSSTESAQDQTERGSNLQDSKINGKNNNLIVTDHYQTSTKRRQPSKIPLPGTKGYLAPKPPTGRQILSQSQIPSRNSNTSSSSGPGSNKSLSRSTGNLYGKSPNSLSQYNSGSNNVNNSNNNNQQNNQNRPDSAQSYRKDNSLGGMTSSTTTTISRSSSSSIPISSSSPAGMSSSAMTTPTTNNTSNSNKSTPSPQKYTINLNSNLNNSSSTSSPVPIKPKRDFISSRARHLDSLTRFHAAASAANAASSTLNSVTPPITATTTTFGSNINNSGGNISGSSFILNNSYNSNNNSSNNYNNKLNSSSTTTTTTNRINNSKKDLSSNSFTHGHLRKNSSTITNVVNSTNTSTTLQGTTNQRRVNNSALTGRNQIGSDTQNSQQQQQQHQQQTIDADSGKMRKSQNVLSVDSLDANFMKTIERCKTKQHKSQIHQDLIHEFMIKNYYVPPSILEKSENFKFLQNSDATRANNLYDDEYLEINTNRSQYNYDDTDLEKSYQQNPELLFEIEMEEQEDDHESDQDKEDFVNYLLNESLLSQRNKEFEEEVERHNKIFYSTSVDQQQQHHYEQHNNNINNNRPLEINRIVRTTINNDSECHLIGNVNPKIAKTWQQLNSKTLNHNYMTKQQQQQEEQEPSTIFQRQSIHKNHLSRSISNNSDESEKILFYQSVYENKDNFQVNKVNYLTDDDLLSSEQENDDNDEEEEEENLISIESYFDSIEYNEPFNLHKNEIDNESNCCYNGNLISYTSPDGGEEMADLNSYDC